MYAAVTNPPDICYPLIFAEHFQHALSHGEATENINAGYKHRDKTKEANPAAWPICNSAPTTIIPEIALVTDINGVCSACDTFHTT